MSELLLPTNPQRRKPARIHFQDGDLLVTPDDQDIFFISASKATEACRNHIRVEERVSRFRQEVLRPLNEWCADNQQRVSACFVVSPSSAVLLVYVVSTSERYDYQLTTDLTALSEHFDKRAWSVVFSQIPYAAEAELAGYFDINQSLQVYP